MIPVWWKRSADTDTGSNNKETAGPLPAPGGTAHFPAGSSVILIFFIDFVEPPSRGSPSPRCYRSDSRTGRTFSMSATRPKSQFLKNGAFLSLLTTATILESLIPTVC